MFDIELCEERKIGWVRFYGELTEADFEALDRLTGVAKDAGGYDVVYDMSGVEHAHLATDFISRRGHLPQASPGRQRFYVVVQDDLKLLVRLYAAYQVSAGWSAPVIVDSLGEALERLKIARSDFKPFRRPD